MAATRGVTDGEYAMLASLRAALREFLSFSERAAADVGLHAQQHQAMLALRGFGGDTGLTVGELAEHLGLRHHSAVGLVDRLEKHGLVVRHQSSSDRRQVHVTLTAAGRRVLERLTSAHRDELRRIGPELTALIDRISSAGAADAARVTRRSGKLSR